MALLPDGKIYCYKCSLGIEWDLNQRLLRHEECPGCKSLLHCCKMCDFYDVGSYNDCREPNAERVVEKEKANFCSYFKIKWGEKNTGKTKDQLLSAADALFKK